MHRLDPARRLFAALVAALLVVMAMAVSSAWFASSAQAPGPWQDVDPAALPSAGSTGANPTGVLAPQVLVTQGRYLRLDVAAMHTLLAQAPLERAPGGTAPSGAAPAGFVLELPLPDGSTQRFAVMEAPTMAPGLAARYPQIKTYAGQGLDDPAAIVRLDMTPQGLHAMLLRPAGAVYIDPLYRQRDDLYVAYNKPDLQVDLAARFPELPPQEAPLRPGEAEAFQIKPFQAAQAASGAQLRTYRLAVAATGEYTAYHGGTKALGLAAIVTAMNRVNGIYQQEVAVRMLLVEDNDDIVYTDPAADPYTNDNGYTLLSQNQANLDAVLGDGSYDIGHIFSTGGGGVASLGVPCRAGLKARGVTGLPAPTGDAFWVDYVAHEMGHQFFAYHTFNGSAGACSGGNRVGAYAYEPGSGSTIMAYAGICGDHDLQPNSDAYFHTISFDQIVEYTTSGIGDSCAQTTLTGNQPPTILSATHGYTIPRSTPFMLSGAASDPNGDPLTYQWEQFDPGPLAGAPPGKPGYVVPPHFRSFYPTTTAQRIFPRMADIVNNTVSVGEMLPSAAGPLHFRFTVRDNHPGTGGVRHGDYSVTVSSAAGPFRVIVPNTGVLWRSGSQQTIAWEVANTNQAPVNCTKVDIRLSTDGGYTYPQVLAEAVANDGAQEVWLPALVTQSARVQVACVDNIFFDISDANFAIQYPTLKLAFEAGMNPVYAGETFTYTLAVANPGSVPLPAVVVTDTLPAQVTYLSNDAGCSLVTPGVLRCALGDLPVQANRRVHIAVQAPDAPGLLENQASASLEGMDLDLPDNQAELETTVLAPTDLNLALELVTPDRPASAGQPFTYTLAVFNQSLLPVSGVVVTDTLPAQAAYLADSAGCTLLSGAPTRLRCALGELAARARTQLTIQVLAPSTEALTLTNQAAVGFAGIDAYNADNQASLHTPVTASSDLRLQLRGPAAPVYTAAWIDYTLTISNTGPSTAVSVLLVTPLPQGSTFIAASPGCALSSSEAACLTEAMASGASQVYTLTLAAPSAIGPLHTQAQVNAATYDPLPANNQAQATTLVERHAYYFPFIRP